MTRPHWTLQRIRLTIALGALGLATTAVGIAVGTSLGWDLLAPSRASTVPSWVLVPGLLLVGLALLGTTWLVARRTRPGGPRLTLATGVLTTPVIAVLLAFAIGGHVLGLGMTPGWRAPTEDPSRWAVGLTIATFAIGSGAVAGVGIGARVRAAHPTSRALRAAAVASIVVGAASLLAAGVLAIGTLDASSPGAAGAWFSMHATLALAAIVGSTGVAALLIDEPHERSGALGALVLTAAGVGLLVAAITIGIAYADAPWTVIGGRRRVPAAIMAGLCGVLGLGSLFAGALMWWQLAREATPRPRRRDLDADASR